MNPLFRILKRSPPDSCQVVLNLKIPNIVKRGWCCVCSLNGIITWSIIHRSLRQLQELIVHCVSNKEHIWLLEINLHSIYGGAMTSLWIKILWRRNFTCIFIELHPPRRPIMCHDRMVYKQTYQLSHWTSNQDTKEQKIKSLTSSCREVIVKLENSHVHHKLKKYLSPMDCCRIRAICMSLRIWIWKHQLSKSKFMKEKMTCKCCNNSMIRSWWKISFVFSQKKKRSWWKILSPRI